MKERRGNGGEEIIEKDKGKERREYWKRRKNMIREGREKKKKNKRKGMQTRGEKIRKERWR